MGLKCKPVINNWECTCFSIQRRILHHNYQRHFPTILPSNCDCSKCRKHHMIWYFVRSCQTRCVLCIDMLLFQCFTHSTCFGHGCTGESPPLRCRASHFVYCRCKRVLLVLCTVTFLSNYPQHVVSCSRL